MLGSISKIRPCGHHHYYKYGHAKNYQDAYRVEPNSSNNYKNDDYNGLYEKSFHNIVTFWGYDAVGVFQNKNVRKYIIEAPSATNVAYLFCGNSSNMDFVQDVELKNFNWNKITNQRGIFYACPISKFPDTFNPTSKDFYDATRSCYCLPKLKDDGYYYYPYNKNIDEGEQLGRLFYGAGDRKSYSKWLFDPQYKFESVKDIGAWCWNTWPFNGTGIQGFTGFSLKNVERGTGAFNGCVGLKTFSTTDNMDKLTNAEGMFAGCYNLTSLYPDKTSFTLKSLTKAKNMFGSNGSGEGYGKGSKLDKPSTLKLCNALPTHTDGAEHLITIGIHIDHKYDPEVNLALKRVCKTYTTPIEEFGSSLGTTVSSDKGWTLTIQWNGTATENAYPAP